MDEICAQEIDVIYKQLENANIMFDKIGEGRCAYEKKGCDRWPLKGFSK